MRPSARRNGTVRALTVVAGVSLALALAADRVVHASPAGAWTAFAPPQGGDGVGVYDPVRHRFIQFDAYHHAWALDLNADSTWTQFTFSGEPPRLTGASAIYDPNGDRMIVFGGIEQHDDLSTAFSSRVHALSLSGTPTWTELFPTGGPPLARTLHSAVYDPNAKRMIVFGGYSIAAPLRDVWTLSLTGTLAWSSVSLVPGPAARGRHVAAFDAARNLMLVSGGNANTPCQFKDLWSLTFNGSPTWHFLVTNGDPAPCTDDETAVFDPVNDRMYITGRVSGVPQRVVWEVKFAGPQPTWINTGVHGINGFIYPDATTAPTVALDTGRHRLIANGGGNGRAGTFALRLGPTWRWDPLGPPEAPGNERWMASVVDPANGNPIRVSNTSHWTFDLAAGGRWRRLPMSGVTDDSAGTAASIVDRKRSRIVTFGGRCAGYAVWLDAVRTVPLDGSAPWSRMPTSGTGPSGRCACSAVYDSLRDRMLVYGGTGLGGGADSTVYALSLADGVWSKLDVTGSPPIGRNGHAAAYDPVRDRMLVLLGGYDAFRWHDCWALDLAGPPSWEQLSVSGAPPPSLGRSASYDPVRDRLIVTGFDQGDSFVDGTGGRVDAVTLAGIPSWVTLSEHITQVGPHQPAPYGYDAFHDRLLSAPALWEFPFGSSPLATLGCPGDLVWTPGSTLTVSYGVTNPDPADQFADYTLTSERSWPGLPISGNVQVPGQGGADIVVQVAVPDTAAHGLNTLSLHVTLRDSGTPLDCSNHLHDLATAALGSLALMELLADGVSLTWQAPGAADEPALVERGDASGWSVIGSADEVGSGVFRFLDASARRGATYSYRLVSARDRTRLLTAVATVTIPEQVAFALQILSANPSDAGWSLALDLPRAGIAHLTLFDVAGRRIESRDARLDAAGRAIVSLGAGSRPAPGVYTAVVRFHGERRVARLVRFP